MRDEPKISVRKLRSLEELDSILVGDLILLEVLQGAKSEAHAARIEKALRQFEIANLINEELAVFAARNYRILRGKGVTIRNKVDVIIGTFCIARGHMLLHDGRDFDPMATHLGLRVV